MIHSKPLFPKHDDMYDRRKQNKSDELYNTLNLYHQNVKLTIELNQTKFVVTEIIRSNSKVYKNIQQQYSLKDFTIDTSNGGKEDLIMPQWLFKGIKLPNSPIIFPYLQTFHQNFSQHYQNASDYEDKNRKLALAKHLKENPTHKDTWYPENFRQCIALPAYFIKTVCPNLNDQLDNDTLALFRSGITFRQILVVTQLFSSLFIYKFVVIKNFNSICT